MHHEQQSAALALHPAQVSTENSKEAHEKHAHGGLVSLSEPQHADLYVSCRVLHDHVHMPSPLYMKADYNECRIMPRGRANSCFTNSGFTALGRNHKQQLLQKTRCMLAPSCRNTFDLKPAQFDLFQNMQWGSPDCPLQF